MRKVVVESPYAPGQGFTQSENVTFALACCKRLVVAGCAPIASHLFYPRFLDDKNDGERSVGMQCGFEWGLHADEIHFYLRRYKGRDEDFSRGMGWALVGYEKAGKHIKIFRCHPDGEIIEIEEELNAEPSDA